MVKTLAILGATGSIGASTLDLVRQHPSLYRVEVLTAHSNTDLLIALAHEFKPKYVAGGDYNALKAAGLHVLSFDEAASVKVDLCVAAITGIAGLSPVWHAISAGNTIALANKETLVAAGDLVMAHAKANNVTILPVDSEHNALFQALAGSRLEDVSSLILTASGGPFRTWDAARIAHATPKEALKHPNWSMGAKVTIDSASLMNKGLEVIEAYHLFGLTPEVIVHPQSVVHGLVSYKDGSFIAQMGASDMRIPIASCLAYPSRIVSNVAKLDLVALAKLTFEAPDRVRFPCLKLAEEALKSGNTCVLNAANEVAVAKFLRGEITFGAIAEIVENALEEFDFGGSPTSLDAVFALDASVRRVLS
jgi:1-deoxy-D-xylulose-5-phosphate reductoisomerase